jgi:hypothetical protein
VFGLISTMSVRLGEGVVGMDLSLQGTEQSVYTMKPRNQRHMIRACMLSHISQLHGAEEMRVGPVGHHHRRPRSKGSGGKLI